MDPLFGSIQISSSVKIKRSDGRVHLAKVVQLSPESKSVGVEWSENGEVKGKEILADLVLELNEDLRPNKTINRAEPTALPVMRTTASTTPANVSNSIRESSPSGRLTLDIDQFEREYDSRPPPALPPQLLQRFPQYPVGWQTPSSSSPVVPINGYLIWCVV
jgi:hypothetical protein